MKIKFIPFLILIVSIFSCHEEKTNDYTIITGQVSRDVPESITIYDFNYKTLKTLELYENNSFKDTLIIPEGIYLLSIGSKMNPLYLKNNLDLNITINTNEESEFINYSGTGANENNYLLEKDNYFKTLPVISPTSSKYVTFNEKEFLDIVESNYRKKINFLNKHQELDKDFLYFESNSYKYEKLAKLSFYESNMRFLTNNQNFKVSSSFPKIYEDIDLTNEKLSTELWYITYLRGYIKFLANNKIQKDNSLDRVVTLLKTIDEELNNQKVKDELSLGVGRWSLKKSNEIDQAYKEFNSIVKNDKYKDEIKQIYLKLKRISYGDVSPKFELNDINNNKISLSDFKGKFVYISIWNTWCKPCLLEIPRIEKLKEAFKNEKIQFISICINSEKENWNSIVKSRNLSEIQLFAPDNDIPFLKDYVVYESPRYILLDDNGKIVDAYADRPSNQKMKEKLMKLL